MHSQFSPIWQIFLPVYHRPSKRASCFISNLENLASTKVHRAIFTSEMLGTFFWCQHRLAIAVQNQCFSKTKFEWGSPHHMEPGHFSPFWRVVKLLYLVSAKGFLAYIARQGNTPHPIVEISTILQIEYLPNSF